MSTTYPIDEPASGYSIQLSHADLLTTRDRILANPPTNTDDLLSGRVITELSPGNDKFGWNVTPAGEEGCTITIADVGATFPGVSLPAGGLVYLVWNGGVDVGWKCDGGLVASMPEGALWKLDRG
jgi:hypothetical protein